MHFIRIPMCFFIYAWNISSILTLISIHEQTIWCTMYNLSRWMSSCYCNSLSTFHMASVAFVNNLCSPWVKNSMCWQMDVLCSWYVRGYVNMFYFFGKIGSDNLPSLSPHPRHSEARIVHMMLNSNTNSIRTHFLVLWVAWVQPLLMVILKSKFNTLD